MSTPTIPASRWRQPSDAAGAATTRGDSVADIREAEAIGYTQTIGLLASSQRDIPVKYLYFTKPAVPGARHDVPVFEIEEGYAGDPGATVATLSDWPVMWEHPERGRTLKAIACLAARVDDLQRDAWSAVLEAIEMALELHGAPNAKFEKLASKWREETSVLSDPHEIFLHPSYQEIIGMGTLALPFIFATLEKQVENWFWALRAITGENPVNDRDLGDLDKMTQAWLNWASTRRRKLTLGWLHAFAASEVVND